MINNLELLNDLKQLKKDEVLTVVLSNGSHLTFGSRKYNAAGHDRAGKWCYVLNDNLRVEYKSDTLKLKYLINCDDISFYGIER